MTRETTLSAAQNPMAAENKLPWIMLAAGLAAMVIPSAVHLWNTLWDDEAYAHGPIVLLIIIWVVSKITPPPLGRAGFLEQTLGFVALAMGVVIYVVGRSQNLPILDITALIPICVASLLIFGGWAAVRAYWFPLLFLLFLIPLPGFI